jgi:hypothetical protein
MRISGDETSLPRNPFLDSLRIADHPTRTIVSLPRNQLRDRALFWLTQWISGGLAVASSSVLSSLFLELRKYELTLLKGSRPPIPRS